MLAHFEGLYVNMKHVFWLKQGVIAGRSGPNRDMWDLGAIESIGFSAILSVNDGEAVHETMISGVGMQYANIPMSSNAPPRNGDKQFCLENIPKAMEFIQMNLPSGPVLVHCRSGKDRTGMVLAAYLIYFEGYDVKQAMEKVLSDRQIAFSAEGWFEFAREVLSLCKVIKEPNE